MDNTDPREQLVTLSNQIMDTLYELEPYKEKTKRMNELARLPKDVAIEEVKKLDGPQFAEMLMDSLKIQSIQQKRDALIGQYVAIRRTLEATGA